MNAIHKKYLLQVRFLLNAMDCNPPSELWYIPLLFMFYEWYFTSLKKFLVMRFHCMHYVYIICGCIYYLLVFLTLKVLVVTIDAQWEGMGDVGSAKYELALLPPCPTIRVLSYSN